MKIILKKFFQDELFSFQNVFHENYNGADTARKSPKGSQRR